MRQLAIFILSIFVFAGASAQQGSINAKKLGAFMNVVEQTYVDTVNSGKLAETAINSMLKELDPHSVYISKEDLQKMNEPLEGKFEGIGIQFNILRDTIMVVSPIAGGPSEKLGIMSGDRIVKIDGEVVAGVGFTNQDVMDNLRGEKGTKVNVSIYRRGVDKLIEFEITRDKIPIYSVDAAYMINDETGYIKVNRFAAKTIDEFRKGMDSLKEKGMDNLILDLRGNSGGYLKTAIQLADEFLEEDRLVVYTEGRVAPRNETYSTKKGDFEAGKVAVLIDQGSASASEIVTGAVQDWDRGIVVGRRSFGKGLVQKPYMLPDGSAIRLTISRYHTPSGRCIQRPYEDGNKKDYYKEDMQARLESGEFYSADSIDIDEGLKFQTNNGRTVYGGGGIIPDIFVPLDTTFNSDYYSDLVRKGAFYEFTLTYMDNHRDQLEKKYKNVNQFKDGFSIDEQLLEDLYAYGDKKEIERNEKDIARSEAQIKNLMKAYIARNMYGTGAYYNVINEIDPAYQKALEVLEDNTFRKMKLSYR